MKISKYFVITFCFLIYVPYSFASKESSPQSKKIEILSSLKPIFSSRQPRKTDFTSNRSIVHVWATWCAPCLEEIPEILTFLEANPEVIDKFYFVSLDEDEKEHKKFWHKMIGKNGSTKYPKVVFLQDKKQLLNKIDIKKVPETHILQKGKTVRRMIGPQTVWNNQSFLSFINSIN